MPENLVSILLAALLVESVVNTVVTVKNKDTDWRYWLALGVSIGGSVLVSYNWNLDIFSALLGEGNIPYVGAVLTGFIVARGSNAASDLLKLVNAARARLAT